uniref:Uncharacterized protein n=1 Tax=Eutreptiella gymnastica TaxID=73025 RepID=A0A7S1J0C6_9EUGL
MLHDISPCGIAKVNVDAAQGISPEATLAVLKEVYDAWKTRKAVAEDVFSNLGETPSFMFASMGRPPSAEEVDMLRHVDKSFTRRDKMEIDRRLRAGDQWEDIIEEMTTNFHHTKMLRVAEKLAEEHNEYVGVSHLVSTQPPLANLEQDYPTIVLECHRSKLCIRPSPVMTWFRTNPGPLPLYTSCTPLQRKASSQESLKSESHLSEEDFSSSGEVNSDSGETSQRAKKKNVAFHADVATPTTPKLASRKLRRFYARVTRRL